MRRRYSKRKDGVRNPVGNMLYIKRYGNTIL